MFLKFQTTLISNVGGKDNDAKLRSAIRRIVGDEALLHFTWKGTLAKDPFIQFTNINDVLKDAIRSNDNVYTDYEHNEAMKVYLKHSSDRINKKKKRFEPTTDEFEHLMEPIS